MDVYKTKIKKLGATRSDVLNKQVRLIFREVGRKTKRQPYIRSAYFKNEKIFFTFFWQHLGQKSQTERPKRMRYVPCALDLIQHSKAEPTIKTNPNRKETLYRFTGLTPGGELFYVQIKENLKSKRKYFMSVFPDTG